MSNGLVPDDKDEIATPGAAEVPLEINPLIMGILHVLWQTLPPHWLSLPRITKQLNASGSEVLRMLTLLSSAQWGVHKGYGWVTIKQEEGRWLASLNESGRVQCNELFGNEHDQDAVQQ